MNQLVKMGESFWPGAFFIALAGALGVAQAEPLPSAVDIQPIVLTEAEASPLIQAVNDALDLKASTIQQLTFSQRAESEVGTAILVAGNTWTLDLQKHSVRSPDFQVLVQDASGALTPVDPPPVRTYKGTIRELPGSEVRASYGDTGLEAILYTPEGVYGIQPLADLIFASQPGQHAVYKASDWVNREGYTCGTDAARHKFDGFDGLENLNPEDITPPTRGTGYTVADIGVDADFEFYQLNGSNVTNTVQDMEGIINGLETIYETQLNITYDITVAIVRTAEPDPYTATNPETLLVSQFQPHWNSSPQSFIQRDLAHLFTGKNLDGSIIGIAYLGVVCFQSSAYGLVQSRFTANMTSRIALSAHEIGHNWNAAHCDGCASCTNCCRIMCSGLGGCSGILTSFGCQAVSQMSAYRDAVSCDSPLADPQPVPFFDDFPSTTLNTAKWSYNKGAAINTSAMNEPSAPNAIELDAAGTDNYRDDDLRTNFILMSGLSNVRLSYYTQHRGVESGEQLVVEFYRNTRFWEEINRITSDGVDQTAFDFHTHILPANANWNEFRVRFRPEVNETNDDWFIDDVTVSTSCASDTDCNDNQHCNGVETCVGSVCLPGTPPSCPGQFCSEVLDMCVDCLTSADCTDGLFCNGFEGCDGSGNCQVGNNPCTNPSLPHCNESTDQCVQCLTAAHCSDGVFCNGAETCTNNTCGAGTNPCPGLACLEDEDACAEAGDMYCELSRSGVAPGGTVDLEIFAVGVRDIRSYQTTINMTLTSGTGSVFLNCPTGTVIDDSRPDFIFYNLNDLPVPSCSLRRIASTLLSGSVFVGALPVYLGTYTLNVSADATVGSTFDISIAPPLASTLRDANNALVTFDILPPCTLSVVECNPCQLYGDIFPFEDDPFVGDCMVDVDDLGCAVAGFNNPADCPYADLNPCGGDGDVDVDDILEIIFDFAGMPNCPDPC